MKRIMLFATLWLLSCAKVDAPDPIYPIPTQQQIDWQKLEQYAFVHFGLNSFNDQEWGYGDASPELFDPTNLDTDQWVKTMKAAGLKGVILTAKHHDGFNLWQSKYTDYSVKNSPWMDGQGDMVRNLVASCRKYDMKFGLYLSPWDRNHAEYARPEYVEYFQNQIRELITEYCDDVEMFEYWFDGANGGDGYYGGARETRSIDAKTYYQYDKCVDIIHGRFPNAMIFGGTEPTIRWIGNESGWAGQTNWAMTDKDAHYTSHPYGRETGSVWLPGEVDVSVRPGWFYHQKEDHQVRSVSNLVNLYYESVGRNANLLLSFPVSTTGTIHPIDSARVVEWWQTIEQELKTDLLAGSSVEASDSRGRGFSADNVTDGSWDSYWATGDGVNSGDITFTFDSPTQLNRLLLQEYIALGQRVKAFSVEYFSGDHWLPIKTLDSMTTVGYKRIIRFESVEAQKLRVNFLDSRGPLTINNIEAFCAPAIMEEPVISRDKTGLVTIKAGDSSSDIFYTLDGGDPTVNSLRYEQPFLVEGAVEVRAIAQDNIYTDRISPISLRKFNVLSSGFSVADAKGSENMFDSDQWTNFSFKPSREGVEISLGKEYRIAGFTYLPNQQRYGGGYISSYELWADGVLVASGEFSNIEANPIEQVVKFDKPVTARNIRFVALSTVGDSATAIVSEFGIVAATDN